MRPLIWLLALTALSLPAAAQDAALPMVVVRTGSDGAQTWSLSIQILLLMTALTLLPAALLMMTSFTRIIIVLGFMRQAIGTAQTPPNQVLLGLALFLTLFVMSPVLTAAWDDGVKPYMDGEIAQTEALQRMVEPFRGFMLAQTRDSDLDLFARIARSEGIDSRDSVPLPVLVPAFVTSELKTAFQMGFLLFIPFLVIDLVVSSLLMSMGMMMLSPMIISLPFKVMLFVLVDGWSLLIGTLAASFYV